MAKKKIVTDAPWGHPDFHGMTMGPRFLYVGMLVISDENGVVCSDSNWLRQRLLMWYPTCRRSDVDAWLDAMSMRGLIRPTSAPRSDVDSGLSYCQITNFAENNRLARAMNRIEENRKEYSPPPPSFEKPPKEPPKSGSPVAPETEEFLDEVCTRLSAHVHRKKFLELIRSGRLTRELWALWGEVFEAERRPGVGVSVFREQVRQWPDPRKHPDFAKHVQGKVDKELKEKEQAQRDAKNREWLRKNLPELL